jgi:hypothetical protein
VARPQAAVQLKSDLGRMRFELEASENEKKVLTQNAAELNGRIENLMGVINAKHDANQKLSHSEEARCYRSCAQVGTAHTALSAVAGPARQARASPHALGASSVSERDADDARADARRGERVSEGRSAEGGGRNLKPEDPGEEGC